MKNKPKHSTLPQYLLDIKNHLTKIMNEKITLKPKRKPNYQQYIK